MHFYTLCTGMVGALTNESATSKAVYFSHSTSEMTYITRLLAENPGPLAGPLLADTYVTLLKGRNAWYGGKLASGEIKIEMGDTFSGKGTIQGISAVEAFYELLRQPSLSVMHPALCKPVRPVELCPILRTLYKILIQRTAPIKAIVEAYMTEYDPRFLVEFEQPHIPELLRRDGVKLQPNGLPHIGTPSL
jgi:glycerol-3-phosphate dehydrogenase (NAD+)